MTAFVCTMLFVFGPLDMNSTKPVTWADLNLARSGKEQCFVRKGHRMPKRRL
jgi:hypothetical protein